jgi:sRNA-binding regulator protein Hfq
MKVKPVYVASSEDIRLATPAPEVTEQTPRQPKPAGVGNLERDILQRWHFLTIIFDNGGELDCELIEFGTYWLHVQTEDGERVINKSSIEQIAPRDGGA